MLGISVIICSYNGEERLPETLRHLACQECSFPWEVILVANACTDATASTAWQLWEKLGMPVHLEILEQPTPGKSHALELAVQQARFEYVLICDDDNWLSRGYIQLGYDIMESHPEYGILGGRAEAVSDISIPEWFYEIQYAYACGSPASVSVDLTGRYFLWGAGMIIRKKVASIILHPDQPTLLTGRNSGQLSAGEDDEKCVRTWFLGYRTFFDYRLLFYHYMPAVRLTEQYKTRLLQGFHEQGAVIGAYRRLYYSLKHSHKGWKTAWQLIVFLLNKLTRNHTNQRIARDYLYFYTRKSIWRTETNGKVLAFYDFVLSTVLKQPGTASTNRPLQVTQNVR